MKYRRQKLVSFNRYWLSAAVASTNVGVALFLCVSSFSHLLMLRDRNFLYVNDMQFGSDCGYTDCHQKIKVSSYGTAFTKTVQKNGLFLKIATALKKAFCIFFFLIKKNDSTYSDLFNGFKFSSELFSYISSARGLFFNYNLVMLWILNFLDIRFWLTCVKKTKKKLKKNQKQAPFSVEVNILDKSLKKLKYNFKFLYLESLNYGGSKWWGSKQLKYRLLHIIFDTTFNYKNSQLYLKKLAVYKKLFRH